MKTLEDARRYEEANPGSVEIQREVRYFASYDGARYALAHDWTLEMLDRKTWVTWQEYQTPAKPVRGGSDETEGHNR